MRVSIAVPIYNVSNYIERCLISLFEQTYKDIEYVFVNDGSKDNSVEILWKVLARYPGCQQNTKFVDRKTNKGIAATRNELIKNSSGDYISFVDADDYIDIDIIEKLVEEQERTNADIVSSGFVVHKGGKCTNVMSPHLLTPEENLNYILAQGSSHELFCRIIKRDLIIGNGITFVENLNISEDWVVMVKCYYYAEKVAFLDNCGYHYNCDNTTSAMASYKDRIIKKQIENLKAFVEISNFLNSVNYNSTDDFFKYASDKVRFVKWEAVKSGNEEAFRTIVKLQKSIGTNGTYAGYGIKEYVKAMIANLYGLIKLK